MGKKNGLYKKELPWYSCLDCHSLGECLRALREKEGLTQKQVANYLQLSRSTYTYYELGKRQPNLQTLSRLAELFHVSADYLLGRMRY